MVKKNLVKANKLFNHLTNSALSELLKSHGLSAYGTYHAILNVLIIQQRHSFSADDLAIFAPLIFSSQTDVLKILNSICANPKCSAALSLTDGIYLVPPLQIQNSSPKLETEDTTPLDEKDIPKNFPRDTKNHLLLSDNDISNFLEKINESEFLYLCNEVEDWLKNSSKGRSRKSHAGTIRTFIRNKKARGLVYSGLMPTGPGYYPHYQVQKVQERMRASGIDN